MSNPKPPLFQNRPERAVPLDTGRIAFVVSDPRQVQLIQSLICARQFAALGDQLPRLAPVLPADGLEEMMVKHAQSPEFGRDRHAAIAHQRIQSGGAWG